MDFWAPTAMMILLLHHGVPRPSVVIVHGSSVSVVMKVEWMMIPTGGSILASTVLEKVYAVGFIRSLRQYLHTRIIASCGP